MHVKVAFLAAHHQADVHVLYALVLFIREKHNEYSSGTAVHVWLDALWLEGVVIYQALQIGEGDPLHVQGALQWCKADVPKVEGLIAGHYVPGQRLWRLSRICSKLRAAICKKKNRRINADVDARL